MPLFCGGIFLRPPEYVAFFPLSIKLFFLGEGDDSKLEQRDEPSPPLPSSPPLWLLSMKREKKVFVLRFVVSEFEQTPHTNLLFSVVDGLEPTNTDKRKRYLLSNIAWDNKELVIVLSGHISSNQVRS